MSLILCPQSPKKQSVTFTFNFKVMVTNLKLLHRPEFKGTARLLPNLKPLSATALQYTKLNTERQASRAAHVLSLKEVPVNLFRFIVPFNNSGICLGKEAVQL